MPTSQHEGKIYDPLQSIEGKRLPVYLANIDLKRPWHDLHVRLIHMRWGLGGSRQGLRRERHKDGDQAIR